MAKKLASRFPKALYGSVVVYPADCPPEPAEGEIENWKVANQRKSAQLYPWRVLHVIDSGKVGEGRHDKQDSAIAHGRKIALDFNTTLFVEDEDAIREIAVEPEGDVDQNLLSKVRKLISKAESTEHEAERDAFLAKAQEWMVRHAIDMSLVKDDSTAKDMVERNVVVGNKGAGVWAKRDIVNAVASFNNLRSWSVTHSYYSVIAGYREDVAFGEMLLTSLMLQMEQEMAVAVKDKPEWTHHSTFRANFMEAYVSTVKWRLSDMEIAAVDEAAKVEKERKQAVGESMTDKDAVTSVELVLTSRKAKVSEWVDKNHKFVNASRSLGEYCGSSRQAGQRAGERADLSGGSRKQMKNTRQVKS